MYIKIYKATKSYSFDWLNIIFEERETDRPNGLENKDK